MAPARACAKAPSSLTSLMLAPARFDDFNAEAVAVRLLKPVTKLESLTVQKPYGARWPHLRVPPGPRLSRLRRLVAIDFKLDMNFCSRSPILHATSLT